MNFIHWACTALLFLLAACGSGGGPATTEALASAPTGAPVVKHGVTPMLLLGTEDPAYTGYALGSYASGNAGVNTLQKEGCTGPAFAMNPATGLVDAHCRIGGAYRLNTVTGGVTRNTLISDGNIEDAGVACATKGTCYFSRGLHAPFGNLPSVADLTVINADGTLAGVFTFPDEKEMRVPGVLGMSTLAGREVLVAVLFDVAQRDVAVHRFDTANQTFVGSCVLPGRFEKGVVDGGRVALTALRRANDTLSPDVLVVDATTCTTVAEVRLPTDAPEVVFSLAHGLILNGDTLTIAGGTYQEESPVHGVWQYNIRNGSLVKELPLPAAPIAIAESRTLKRFYVTAGDKLLREIDAKDFTVLRTVPGWFHLDTLFFAE